MTKITARRRQLHPSSSSQGSLNTLKSRCAMRCRRLAIPAAMLVAVGVVWFVRIDGNDLSQRPALGHPRHIYPGHQKGDTKGVQGASKADRVVSEERCVYLVKVHKTGSTTLQNVIYRFGLSRHLRIATYNCPFGMPFPKVASANFLFENTSAPGFVPYDLMAEHAVMSRDVPASYMCPRPRVIASLRQPLSYLRSAFEFFRLAKKFHLANTTDPVSKFLNVHKSLKSYKYAYSLTKNLQLMSFGYSDVDNNDAATVRAFIEDAIDPYVDHMLLLERMDEGLVLLRRQLGWTTRDILYSIIINSKPKKPSNQTAAQAQREVQDRAYRAMSGGDYLLYEYYQDKVERELSEQSQDFWQELEEFRRINHQVALFCDNICGNWTRAQLSKLSRSHIRRFLTRAVTFPSSGFHDSFQWTVGDCVLMRMHTFPFQVAIRVNQVPQVCPSKTGPLRKSVWEPPLPKSATRDWCQKDKHAVYSFPWSLVMSTALKKCKAK